MLEVCISSSIRFSSRLRSFVPYSVTAAADLYLYARMLPPRKGSTALASASQANTTDGAESHPAPIAEQAVAGHPAAEAESDLKAPVPKRPVRLSIGGDRSGDEAATSHRGRALRALLERLRQERQP